MVKKVDTLEIDRRVQAMAARMSITHRLEQKASTLGVNEMQKVAIGRSAIVEPQIFLLDRTVVKSGCGVLDLYAGRAEGVAA